MFKTNMGTTDRLVRAATGGLMLLGILVSPIELFTLPVLYYFTLLLGIGFMLNSLTGMCLIFGMLGLNTCPKALARKVLDDAGF